jgi:septal ring-binding cell division protein DamX
VPHPPAHAQWKPEKNVQIVVALAAGHFLAAARLVGGACLLLIACVAMGASAIDDGRTAYAAGDYRSAIAHWQKLIEEGRPEGQFFLGVMYAEGKGLEPDHAKAFALYTAAAEKDFAPAQYNLANQYATGEGVKQDFSKAEFWWTKAAERGLLPAQVNLGNMYYHGAAGEKNAVLARKWLTLAAEQGSADARETLARLDAEESRTPKAPAEPAVADATVRVAADALRREAWVLAQSEHHYTIQILAAGTDALARDYIQQQGLASRAAYIETAAQGATVYRVLYGSYASRDLADKTLVALPRALSANSPWVRTFAEVHKLVDRRHEARGAR